MSRKLYVIEGMPSQMLQAGSKELREDIKVFRDKNDEIRVRLSLGLFEAMIMKAQITKYNLSHPYALKLTKLRGKRFRV